MKIALLGASPSLSLAPFNDPSWEIWACSDGTVGVPRCDLRFELHDLEFLASEPRYQNGRLDQYLDFLRNCRVYLQQARPDFPNSLTYPKEEMVSKHGPYFFTSSIAWMMALALEIRSPLTNLPPQSIGLWGVDMATDEEYAHQRPGCHYFIEMAKRSGIQIVVPDGCKLLDPPKWEGFTN